MRIVVIVEGHGEVESVPLLIRRIVPKIDPDKYVEVPRPIRVRRSKLLQQGELERAVEFAARQTHTEDGILILIDAEATCPAELAPELLARATQARSDRDIAVVLANTEYEAWFLAAAESIAGERGLVDDLTAPSDPESIGSAKSWLKQYYLPGEKYRETVDQPALSCIFDLAAARDASSFDKLWREIRRFIT